MSPFAGFECPKCAAQMGREQALEHFPSAHGGVLPASVIEAIWRGEEHPRRADDHISPSMAGGCMREYAITRTQPVWINPQRHWKMIEGTLWHEVMEHYAPPGWEAEVELPRRWVETEVPGAGRREGGPPVDLALNVEPFTLKGRRIRRYNGTWEVELWPAIWLSWKIDALASDRSELIDYKSQDSPVGRYVDGKVAYTPRKATARWDQRLQLSIYAYGTAHVLGCAPPRATIWRYTKGIQDAALAWTKIPVELVELGELEHAVRSDYLAFISAVKRTNAEGSSQAISEMPLQGLTMFGGKKCGSYCAVKAQCDKIGGQATWEF